MYASDQCKQLTSKQDDQAYVFQSHITVQPEINKASAKCEYGSERTTDINGIHSVWVVQEQDRNSDDIA